LDAALAYYSDDENALFYEDDTFELKGRNALRKNIQAFFKAASHIRAELGPITVVVNGDLAAAYFTVLFSWKDESGAHSERARWTQILKKVNGKWLIWHEHYSVPYDPATGKAMLEAKQ
jgi:ketosteroid isomerase-like protein